MSEVTEFSVKLTRKDFTINATFHDKWNVYVYLLLDSRYNNILFRLHSLLGKDYDNELNDFIKKLNEYTDAKNILNKYFQNILHNTEEINNLFYRLIGDDAAFSHEKGTDEYGEDILINDSSEPKVENFIKKYINLNDVSFEREMYIRYFLRDTAIVLENKYGVIDLAIEENNILSKDDLASVDSYIKWLNNLNKETVSNFQQKVWDNYHNDLLEKNKDMLITYIKEFIRT